LKIGGAPPALSEVKKQMPKPAQTPQPMLVANVMSPANSSAATGP
jgi:hypothetical protein